MTLRSATWKVEASRISIATNGIASALTCVPNWLIVSAVHSRTKSGWRSRLGASEDGSSGMLIGVPR